MQTNKQTNKQKGNRTEFANLPAEEFILLSLFECQLMMKSLNMAPFV